MEKSTYSEMQKQKRLIERKPALNLNCNRCHQLRSQNKLIKTEQRKFEPGVPLKLSDYVANFDRGNIIRNLFKNIYSRSIIIYVIDITNFEGSQIEEIYNLINKGKHRVLVVVNKIDALPTGFKVSNL